MRFVSEPRTEADRICADAGYKRSLSTSRSWTHSNCSLSNNRHITLPYVRMTVVWLATSYFKIFITQSKCKWGQKRTSDGFVGFNECCSGLLPSKRMGHSALVRSSDCTEAGSEEQVNKAVSWTAKLTVHSSVPLLTLTHVLVLEARKMGSQLHDIEMRCIWKVAGIYFSEEFSEFRRNSVLTCCFTLREACWGDLDAWEGWCRDLLTYTVSQSYPLGGNQWTDSGLSGVITDQRMLCYWIKSCISCFVRLSVITS